jgi:hypothetical protein
MRKNKQKSTPVSLEKIVTFAGLAVVIVGCIANLYGAFANIRFINNPWDIGYYFRFLIMLGGGFAIGYFATRKLKANRLFIGVFYAILTVALFWLIDTARLGVQMVFSEPLFPWGMILFTLTSVIALVGTGLVAYFAQYKPKRSNFSTSAKLILIGSFVIYNVFSLAQEAYYLLSGTIEFDTGVPQWLYAVGHLTTPLAIALFAYLLLGRLKLRLERLFYAAFIGTLYSALIMVLWEFRTNAEAEATNIFSGIVATLSLLFVGVLVWRARKAIK